MRARPTDVLPTLRSCPTLSRIPLDGLRLLAEMAEEERYEAGEVIVARGETAERMGVVARGRLDVHVADSGAPVRILTPGELFGEYGMFSGGIRTATVRAGEESVVYSFAYDRFKAFLITFPQASFVLLESAVARLRSCEARLRELGA